MRALALASGSILAPTLLVLGATAQEVPLLEHFDVVRQGPQVQIGWAIRGDAAHLTLRLTAYCDGSEWGIKFLQATSGDYAARDEPDPRLTGRIDYRLAARDSNGTWTLLGERALELPARAPLARLHGATPNPFNPRTNIAFWLPREQSIRLVLYDAAGRRVRTLVAATSLPAGDHALGFDGRDDQGRPLPSGSYLCRLETESATETRRLTLLK